MDLRLWEIRGKQTKIEKEKRKKIASIHSLSIEQRWE